MIVEIAIPELIQYSNGFPSHWLSIIFLGNRPDEYKIYAIITTYVRVVEAAYVHYKNARQLVNAVWNNHDSLELALTIFQRPILKIVSTRCIEPCCA